MARTRANLSISGRVQGVFFREGMRDMAVRYGVSGWVRNTIDGRVEAVIEGEAEDVKLLIQWCREGPPVAEVESVDVQWAEYAGEFSGFHVRR